MGVTYFLLAFHNHQPVGNFENVFREAFEKCYEPFVHFLEEHPFLRVTLHYSGCLLDWLEGREKKFLNRLKRLVKENQVELLGGGYYEPILPLIPERDARGQLRRMSEYLQERFGTRPLGFWLAERVWEQKIVRITAEEGFRYTVVDDTHFALGGLAEEEIRDFFVTEEEDLPLYLFPIPKFLRYVIPFREPEETLLYLQRVSEGSEAPSLVTYADDGEKLGLWPGTYHWVYREGWLARFAHALEESQSWLSLKTFSEVLAEQKARPVRKVYLPTASYEEMAEWAQSPVKGQAYTHLKRELESAGLWNQARVFLQGGTFRNFLVKYPEAGWMRSRMSGVSRHIERMKKSPAKPKAQQELWQAQCNCPYWHGVFGGLYFHHLRRSTYQHLLAAEKVCRSIEKTDFPRSTESDLDQDGLPEVAVESPPYGFYFTPHRGGTLRELDFDPEEMNVLDVLTRRKEAYHQNLIQRKESAESKGRSIHELEKSASPDVLERLVFDPYERLSLTNLFLAPETTLEELWRGRARLLAKNPTQISFSKAWKREGRKGELRMKGEVLLEEIQAEVIVEKEIRLRAHDPKIEISWALRNLSSKSLEMLWGNEWSFNFYDREREEKGVSRVEVQDGWSRVHLEIAASEPFDYWQFPLETVAQTEKDYRLMHQGIAVFPHWKLRLKPHETFQRTLLFSFSSLR